MRIDDKTFYDEGYNEFDDYEESSDVAKRTISFGSDSLSFELEDGTDDATSSDEEEVVIEDDVDVEPAKLDLSNLGMSSEDMTLEDDGDIVEKDDIISSEEKLRLFSDKIMSAIVGDSDIRRYAIDKLMSFSSPRLFRDENYILFSIYYFYRSKLKAINIDSEFIRLFLNRNRKLLIQSREYIDINSYGDIDGSVELGYIAGVIKHFNRLKTLQDMSKEEFETYFEKYLIEFKAIEANKVFRQSQIILTEGLKIGRRTYIGFDDSQSYCKKRLAEIEGLVDNNMGSGFTRMSEALMEDKSDNKKPVKVCDFGRIKALNDVYGGIYTGLFYSYVAPPKSGKSKLLARLCHNAMLNGQNVTVWAQEGGNDLWNCQMRAIHFDYTYNTGVDVTERKFGVDQDTILRDNFRTDELRQLELSSRLDLASNQSYGSVDLIDRPFNVETFLDDIDTSVKGNGSKMVLIDYLQIIGTSGNKSERERIAEAYKTLLNYCKKNNVAIVSPAQYKQDAFDDLIKRTTVDNADLRTAAGGSSEVLRSPDILFALWATVEDLRNNSMKIISLPSRMSRAFPNINLRIDLGSCQFISVD